MASSQKIKSVSLKSWEFRDTHVEDRDKETMFDVFFGKIRERIVLQRLILIARLPSDADRTELGAHYEKLNFQLGKQYIWENMTGLLLIYPSCLLLIIESSRDILVSVLEDLRDMQQQRDRKLQESTKVVLMEHDLPTRLFQQWSYKVLGTALMPAGHRAKRLHEEEESTETLICTFLSALQNLSKHPDISKKAVPGSVLDETPELIISQEILEKLLARDELLSPQQYLQMYNSPLNVSMDFGHVIRSRCLTTV